jgi:hypothetical protein
MVIDVARLDGYLNGIVALNGKINEYYAGAFLFKKSSNEKLETSLVNYYAPRCQIYFSNITESNLGEVELEIQDFIAENILGCNMQPFNSKDLFDRKKYISFKIMDMVNFLISNPLDEPGHKVNILVHKVEANLNDTNADFIFFCISFDNNILVLQFKHTAQEIR